MQWLAENWLPCFALTIAILALIYGEIVMKRRQKIIEEMRKAWILAHTGPEISRQDHDIYAEKKA